MASIKITQLPNVLGNQINPAVDILPIVRVGADSTDKITVEELGTLFGGGLSGTQYVYVAGNGTDVENAAELQAAYNTAETMSPSATNRITIIAGPGNYNFEASTFVMGTEFIDLVSLDGNRSIVFNAPVNPIFGPSEQGAVYIIANDVFVKGVDVQTKQFRTNSNLNLLKVENCAGGNNSFGGTNASGTYINCIGGDNSFGGAGTSSGTFINCTGGVFSFGGGPMFPSSTGIYENCVGEDYSFGGCYIGGTSSGTYTNCKSGPYSFGYNGNVQGIYNNCIGENASWTNSILTGKLYFCRVTFAQSSPSPGPGGALVAFINGDNFTAQNP
jgi:hypothetical protein